MSLNKTGIQGQTKKKEETLFELNNISNIIVGDIRTDGVGSKTEVKK